MGAYGNYLPGAPPLPPDVSTQMGAGSDWGGGLSAIAQQNEPYGNIPMQPEPQQNTNPYGDLMSQASAIQTVLEQMASAEPGFSPFARQAIESITNGLAALSSAPQASSALPPEMMAAAGGAPLASPPLA